MTGRTPLAVIVAMGLGACQPRSLDENWTCDFDATEGRPLDDPDAPFDDAGLLPASHCMNTCGAPVTRCVRTVLDGAIAGAVCPVCTF